MIRLAGQVTARSSRTIYTRHHTFSDAARQVSSRASSAAQGNVWEEFVRQTQGISRDFSVLGTWHGCQTVSCNKFRGRCQRVEAEPGRGLPGFGLVRLGGGVFDMNREKGQMAACAGAGSHARHNPTSSSPASQKRVRMVILPSTRGARLCHDANEREAGE